MQAVASASKPMEFGKQWQGQLVDGRFPLEQYLGGSDDDAVFLTRISGGGTKAAIKLVRAAARDADAQLTAWRRSAKLSHPNMLRILDGGRCWLSGNDLLFVVSEFAEENLGQVVPQRALTLSEADSMLRPTVDALAYIHHQGLVHARVHPANIMAVGDQLKLASDSIQSPGPPLNKTASAYDAPEVASRQLSPAADIWSLGATLAQSLTQRIPAKADKLPRLQQPFSDIAGHSLREDPAARWSIADVQSHLAGKKVADAPVKAAVQKEPALSPAQAATRSAGEIEAEPRKSRTWMMVAVAAIIAIAVILFAVTRQSSSVASKSSEAPGAGSSAQSANQGAAAPAAVPAAASAGPDQVVNRVLPNPSRSALNTIHGTIKIRVKVDVDSTGSVTHAGFITPGPSQYFSRLAMQAAQQWKFAPSAAVRESTLLFEFNRRGVDASVQQAH